MAVLKFVCLCLIPVLLAFSFSKWYPKTTQVTLASEYNIRTLRLPGNVTVKGSLGVTFYPGEGNTRFLLGDAATLRRVDLKAGTVEEVLGNEQCQLGMRMMCALTGLCENSDPTGCDIYRKAVIDPVTKDIFALAQTRGVLMRVDGTTGEKSIVAGTFGKSGCSGDGGLAKDALFTWLHAVAIHPVTRDLYVSDSENHAVRKIDRTTNIITTVAGTLCRRGFAGDGEPATMAKLAHPVHHDFDPVTHDLLIADFGNEAVRRVDAKTGIISTLAGNTNMRGMLEKIPGFLGMIIMQFSRYNLHPYLEEGVSATSSPLGPPSGLTVSPFTGDVFITIYEPVHIIRRVSNKTGIVTTVAGRQWQEGYSGDDGPACSANLATPQSPSVDPVTGDIWFPDMKNSAVRILTPLQ